MIDHPRRHSVNDTNDHKPIPGAVGGNIVTIDPITELPVKDSGISLASILGGLIPQGSWDASTNTPTLADGIGTLGHFYIVSVAGDQDLGSGVQHFDIGDFVLYDQADEWKLVDVTQPFHDLLSHLAWSEAGHIIDEDIDMDYNNLKNIYDMDEDAIMIANATGGIGNHYIYDHQMDRVVPGAGFSYVEMGSFAQPRVTALISITNGSEGTAASFFLNTIPNQTGGAWHIVRPISGVSGSLLQLVVKVDNSTVDLRLVHIASVALPGTNNIHIINFGGVGFSKTSGTGTMVLPTISLSSAFVRQADSSMDVFGKMEVDERIRGKGTYRNDGDFWSAAGAYNNGTNWIAGLATATIVYISTTGSIQIFHDTGLTPGAIFTPTKIFEISSTGAITSGSIPHSSTTGQTSSDHHVRYSDSEAQAAVKYKPDVNLAGLSPVDADVSAWSDGDRGIGIGTGGRIFLMYRSSGAVKYTELS